MFHIVITSLHQLLVSYNSNISISIDINRNDNWLPYKYKELLETRKCFDRLLTYSVHIHILFILLE